MTTTGPNDPDETPDDERSRSIERAREIVERVLRNQREALTPLQEMINEDLLADVRRSTAAAQRLISEHYAPTSSVARQLAALGDHVNATNKRLADQLSAAMSASQVHELYGQVAAQATIEGTIGVNAVGEVHEIHVDDSMSATDDAQVATPPTRLRPLTVNEWVAAITVLASLNTLIMDLRRADLLDQGNLLLVVAALIVLTSLATPPE